MHSSISVSTLAGFRTGVLACSLGGMLCLGRPARAEDPLPKAVPLSKYAKMAARSPFAPSTAVVAPQATPAPPTPGWADSLSWTNFMQEGDKFKVTVVDAQNLQQHLYLTMEPDPINQMSVASVKWGANRDEPPTIILRKGKETAQVRYESGSGAPANPNGAGGGAPAIPGAVRIPPAPMPGAAGGAAFRPPPMQNTQANGGPSTAIRRPLIRSQPQPPARPAVNAPANGVRPSSAVKVDDDDDDE